MSPKDVREAEALVTAERPEAEPAAEYRPPELIDLGAALDLVQGSQGKHYDGYTGYYWNEEG